ATCRGATSGARGGPAPPRARRISTPRSRRASWKRRSAASAGRGSKRAGCNMSAEIKVPQLGESIVEATVGQWLKGEGDAVAAGEPLVELETDKVNMEVAAPEAGVLQRIAKQAGETVGIGEVLGVVGAGDGAGQQASQAAPAQPQAQAAPQPDAGAPPGLTPPPAPQPPPAQAPAAAAPAAPASPPAPPTITPPAATSAAVAHGPEERVRMSRRRQTIARRLVEAQQTAAMLTTFNELDMSAVM